MTPTTPAAACSSNPLLFPRAAGDASPAVAVGPEWKGGPAYRLFDINRTLEIWQRYLPALLSGVGTTLQVTMGALLLATVLGFVAALGRISRQRLAHGVATVYVEAVRSTPAIVLLFLVYYSLGEVGLALPAFWAAVLSLGVFSGAFYAEIFRAGIEGVHRGQVEAAQALGLPPARIMRRVILPQAAVAILPPATSMAIDTIKATALVVTIGAPDLMYHAYRGASDTFRPMDLFLLAGIIYLVICYSLSRLVRRLEQHAQRARA